MKIHRKNDSRGAELLLLMSKSIREIKSSVSIVLVLSLSSASLVGSLPLIGQIKVEAQRQLIFFASSVGLPPTVVVVNFPFLKSSHFACVCILTMIDDGGSPIATISSFPYICHRVTLIGCPLMSDNRLSFNSAAATVLCGETFISELPGHKATERAPLSRPLNRINRRDFVFIFMVYRYDIKRRQSDVFSSCSSVVRSTTSQS